jgi:fucose 4-O-acetylase-like acetyltransferase
MLKNKKINIGIEILRTLLCLWIVIVHQSIIKKKHIKYLKRHFHVPTFIFLSFIFFYPTLYARVINKIFSRFQRLLIPYIFWPLLILIVNNFLFFFFSFSQFSRLLTLRDIYIQMIIGSRYHEIFWFQFNLIFSSLSFTIISFLFKKNTLKILILLGILSFIIHISGLNYNIFKHYKRYISRNLGSLIELIPIAVNGCLLSSLDILSTICNCSSYFNLILLLIIIILFKYDIFIDIQGFRYSNVLLNICSSLILFLFFGSLSIEKFQNQIFISIIMNITKYTGGIYYTHPIICDYLRKYTFYFNRRNYLSSLFIYIYFFY